MSSSRLGRRAWDVPQPTAQECAVVCAQPHAMPVFSSGLKQSSGDIWGMSSFKHGEVSGDMLSAISGYERSIGGTKNTVDPEKGFQ